jgi:hypothetical protein
LYYKLKAPIVQVEDINRRGQLIQCTKEQPFRLLKSIEKRTATHAPRPLARRKET